ncbi:hypothetical protein OG782_34550 [Streptomyces sp. NBC_00876]|uniref:hypothetical protein n=1 Tax=Streptomyces sp. NBC_00876 TaxID=2975853 RepID=UPI00386E4BBC|nr:hypothetical protein OG782_34550 [Streptomyces sp. NBC_00876]
MELAYAGSAIAGLMYFKSVDFARRALSWVDSLITDGLAYGPRKVEVATLPARWQARRVGTLAAIAALAVPMRTVPALRVDSLLRPAVHEDRRCEQLHVATPEECRASGDWSVPRNHATPASAAAPLALPLVSRLLSLVPLAAA